MKDRPRDIPRVLREPSYLVEAVRVPIQRFIHTEEVGAVILLLGAAAALAWANSPWSESYESFWHTAISFDIRLFAVSEDLRHLVNDGLMAVFFFLVGLEIKRELLHGELSTVRKAALPVVAAVGGMAMPAMVYFLFNWSGDGAAGWGVPMATDIAFALGVLALLGKRMPAELRVFLLGLAVVDDLGVIAVIATFYTETIHWTELALGAAMFVAIAGLIRLGVRSLGLYLNHERRDVAVLPGVRNSCHAGGGPAGCDRAVPAGPPPEGLRRRHRRPAPRFQAGDEERRRREG